LRAPFSFGRPDYKLSELVFKKVVTNVRFVQRFYKNGNGKETGAVSVEYNDDGDEALNRDNAIATRSTINYPRGLRIHAVKSGSPPADRKSG